MARLNVKNWDPTRWPEFLAYVAGGKTMKSWCRTYEIDFSNFYAWMVETGKRSEFDSAMMTRADSIADEIDDLANELLQKYEANPKQGAAMANVYRVTLNAKQWSAAMLNPKRFGQLIQMNQTTEHVLPDKVKSRIDELEKKLNLPKLKVVK